MSQQRIGEIERMRGVAILAVVLIHCSAAITILYTKGSLPYLFYNALNSLMQFAVPLFLFISSLVLSHRLAGERPDLRSFYSRRIGSVLLPYLLWSVFYTVLVTWYQGTWPDLFSVESWGKRLFLGNSFYHLYYLLIIMQLYLVLPWLAAALKRLNAYQTLALAILGQVLFYYLNKRYFYVLYPHPANLLGSYVLVTVIGCWLGLAYRERKELCRRWQSSLQILNILAAACFVVVNLMVRQQQPIEQSLYYAAYQAFVLLTSLNVWLACALRESDFLTRLGGQSFAIYLLHPFILTVWEVFWRKTGWFAAGSLWVGYPLVVAFSYLGGWLITRIPWLSRLLLAR